MGQNIRLEVSLTAELMAVLDDYWAAHAPSSRDEAVAIRALRDREVDAAYAELGTAQRRVLELYPADNEDGLTP